MCQLPSHCEIAGYGFTARFGASGFERKVFGIGQQRRVGVRPLDSPSELLGLFSSVDLEEQAFDLAPVGAR
jgi:hypothetical protein